MRLYRTLLATSIAVSLSTYATPSQQLTLQVDKEPLTIEVDEFAKAQTDASTAVSKANMEAIAQKDKAQKLLAKCHAESNPNRCQSAIYKDLSISLKMNSNLYNEAQSHASRLGTYTAKESDYVDEALASQNKKINDLNRDIDNVKSNLTTILGQAENGKLSRKNERKAASLLKRLALKKVILDHKKEFNNILISKKSYLVNNLEHINAYKMDLEAAAEDALTEASHFYELSEDFSQQDKFSSTISLNQLEWPSQSANTVNDIKINVINSADWEVKTPEAPVVNYPNIVEAIKSALAQ